MIIIQQTPARAQLPIETFDKPPVKPLFELGIGAGSGLTPHYPASSQTHVHTLAFPVAQFRGRIFRAERDRGVSARVLDRAIWAFDISGAGSFAADSEDNRARQGMPDLDLLGEVGPRVYARIETPRYAFQAFMAVRGAFSTDFQSLRYRGLVFSPGLSIEKLRLWRDDLHMGFRLAAEWTSLELQSYFYEVRPQYVRPDRQEYSAKAGYMGSSFITSLGYQKKNWGVFTGVGLNSHSGAANRRSPLFRNELNTSAFVGFVWYFYRSSQPGYD